MSGGQSRTPADGRARRGRDPRSPLRIAATLATGCEGRKSKVSKPGTAVHDRAGCASAPDGAPAVLAALAGGAAMSGQLLARELGLTRAAVWKQVVRLRGLGLAVEAQAGAGYRLAAPFERLDAAAIHAALAPAARAPMPRPRVL